MMIYKLRNQHQGKRCFILGSGPSIASQNLTLLVNEITMCSNWFINHNDFQQLNINYYCAYDDAFVSPEINKSWKSRLEETKILKFFPENWRKYSLGENIFYLPYDHTVKVYRDKKFSYQVDVAVYDAGSVILNFCLPLAFYMGFSEIFLLGVETDYGISITGDPNQGYFYPPSQQKTTNTHTLESQNAWIKNLLDAYQLVSEYAEAKNIKIVNCTPGGNLEVFERQPLEHVLA